MSINPTPSHDLYLASNTKVEKGTTVVIPPFAATVLI